MKENDQILDDEFNQPSEISKNKLTSNIKLRAAIYVLIMMLGGVLYGYYGLPEFRGKTLLFLLSTALVIILQCTVVSLILEVFRFFRRKRKFKKTGIKIIYDPFWFQVVEGGFGIWILFGVLFGLSWFLNG